MGSTKVKRTRGYMLDKGVQGKTYMYGLDKNEQGQKAVLG